MLDFIPSIVSVISFGLVGVSSKKSIDIIGRHKAIVYAYIVLVFLLIVGAVVLGQSISFPIEMMPLYAAQVAMGALGVIAWYKALDYGKVSITAAVGKTYVLLVLASSIFFLGEQLSIGQIMGAVLMVGSTVIIAIGKTGKIKLEKWMIYLAIAILCRTYYYTFIKTFVSELGVYPATLLLELGVAGFVVAFHFLRGRDLYPPKLSDMKYPIIPGILIFIGTVFYSMSINEIGAALTATVSAGGPIINTIGSYILLKEKLDLQKYSAIILIVIGLIMIFVL
ncbi:EamA family transporter [Candidatus Micrarchaeota archaeon]|nr:EamA family transporter [Candidatus Micrarchaeota archaeon]